MPMPVGGGYQQGQQQTCFDKMKFGFLMGFSIGMATGALFGGFGALRLIFVLFLICQQNCGISNSISNPVFFYFRQGMRGRELINTVGKIMVQGGGTFGTFMAIGTGIRC